MRAYDNGCFYSCSVSAADVRAFKRTYACSGLPERSIWFQWDKRNGDLVDVRPNLEDLGASGSAVLAICEDAQRYATRKLGLTDLSALRPELGEA